ncbi:MAG TPA: hypothetical protein VKD22_01920 [Ramlibacter sp.]|nr:hypothetical protein [Ramlibacter sp.]
MKLGIIIAFGAIGGVLALAACTEKTQTIGEGSRHDTPAFQGPATAFTAPGWKAGDRNSWEQELKTRTVNGQNEYTRVD